MKIETGLFDNMVLQVNRKKVCDTEFSGFAEKEGKVFITVKNEKGEIVSGFNHKAIGFSKKGRFKGIIKGIKAGGPYKIEIKIENSRGEVVERKDVVNVLAGYVWIAAGQSNMQGCGLLKDAAKPHPMVRAFYMNDRWDVAKDPIHNLWECVDDVHVDLGVVRGKSKRPLTGTGPAVAFAQEMYRLTKIPQGIIACAHGGTSMSQWDPSLKNLGGKSLYGATLRRVKKNGGKISGIIWYQGESDANEQVCSEYSKKMIKLVSSFRKDLKEPDLPFVAVQIGRLVSTSFKTNLWNSIQNQQYSLLKKIKNFSLVPAVDLSLDDIIHISGKDQNVLGKRLAYAMNVLINGKKAGLPPIQIDEKKIEIRPVPPNYFTEIVLEFKNVAKEFVVPEGIRPTGFSIGDPVPGPFIYDTKIKKNTVVLRTNLSRAGLEGKLLYHGYGLDPVCNIKDASGRLIPVFGPVLLGKFRALTEMVKEWNICFPSEIPEDVDEKLNGLKLEHSKGLDWKLRKFETNFCDLHLEISKLKEKDFVIWFSKKMKIPHPMKLAACIGYDGPVKLWIDDKEIFHDPEGTNPAWEDKAIVRFDADSGEHNIVIALGSNSGNTWGIFFRIERLDVPENIIRSKGTYQMPEFF